MKQFTYKGLSRQQIIDALGKELKCPISDIEKWSDEKLAYEYDAMLKVYENLK